LIGEILAVFQTFGTVVSTEMKHTQMKNVALSVAKGLYNG
jgi:hypothetical protein